MYVLLVWDGVMVHQCGGGGVASSSGDGHKGDFWRERHKNGADGTGVSKTAELHGVEASHM